MSGSALRAGPAAPQAQLSLFDADGAAVAVAPPVWEHPRATRWLALHGQQVGYELRRARRRSIGFSVDLDGLAVSAPRWVGLADIEAALRERGEWILRKLAEQRERRQRIEAARIDWRDGAAVPFLGRPLRLALDPLVVGAVLRGADASCETARLHVGLPREASSAQIRDAVQAWLQRQALRVFHERCALLAPRLGVRMRRLALSAAATRWGSANANGSIRLHWRLIHFALPVIDYVAAHELAHLREMNHSAAFWDAVRSVVPDYERARSQLDDVALPAFD